MRFDKVYATDIYDALDDIWCKLEWAKAHAYSAFESDEADKMSNKLFSEQKRIAAIRDEIGDILFD